MQAQSILFPQDFIDRFWASVDQSAGPDSCWPWQKQRDRKGYGIASLYGRPARASRVAWALANGRLPRTGFLVCHSCDNPCCVNPSHLWEGTAKDNYEDSKRKDRHAAGERHGWTINPRVVPRGQQTGAYTHPESLPRGESHGMAKLTEQKVREIRRRYAAGETVRTLAREIRVDNETIRNVVRCVSWRHVTDEEDTDE